MASRLDNICPHLKRLCSLCEPKFGQPMLVAFPPQVLHLPLPDLPVPKHSAHQRTRSSDPHLGHRLPSLGRLLIAVALWPPIAIKREASVAVCEFLHTTVYILAAQWLRWQRNQRTRIGTDDADPVRF